MVPQCQIPPCDVVQVVELKVRVRSPFHLQHFPSLIIGGCVGLTAQRGLDVCEDYWQNSRGRQIIVLGQITIGDHVILGKRYTYVLGYSLFLQLMFNLWVAHMTPASLGLYSGLMLRNVEGGGVKGFSRTHKEMNRGCRPMPIRLYHSATRNLPWVSLDFVNEPLLIYSARAADR